MTQHLSGIKINTCFKFPIIRNINIELKPNNTCNFCGSDLFVKMSINVIKCYTCLYAYVVNSFISIETIKTIDV